MRYKYNLYDMATMSNQEMLTALLAREIAPRTIVGTGYINGKQVAIDYLKEQIAKESKGECDTCSNSYDVGSQDNRCGNCGNCGSCCTHKRVCDNCPSGNLATHTVITRSGELALCESCYND